MSKYFKDNFSPHHYIQTYYPKNVGYENYQLLGFYNLVCGGIKGGRLIEIGGGPTIYQLISLSVVVDEIVFTDGLIENVRFFKKWLSGENIEPWSKYIAYVIGLESAKGIPVTKEMIMDRLRLLRSKISSTERLDITNKKKVMDYKTKHGTYDIVDSAFCIDSITYSIDKWIEYLNNIISLLNSSGTLIITSLGNSKKGYLVGKKILPAVDLDFRTIINALTGLGFPKKNISFKIIGAEKNNAVSYSSLICIKAKKG